MTSTRLTIVLGVWVTTAVALFTDRLLTPHIDTLFSYHDSANLYAEYVVVLVALVLGLKVLAGAALRSIAFAHWQKPTSARAAVVYVGIRVTALLYVLSALAFTIVLSALTRSTLRMREFSLIDARRVHWAAKNKDDYEGAIFHSQMDAMSDREYYERDLD